MLVALPESLAVPIDRQIALLANPAFAKRGDAKLARRLSRWSGNSLQNSLQNVGTKEGPLLARGLVAKPCLVPTRTGGSTK